MTIAKSLSQKIAEMKTAWYGNFPAPNKPLLVLYVLSQYKKGHAQLFHFQTEIQPQLKELLKKYGPKRRTYETLMPFWRLKNDGFWVLDGDNLNFLESPVEPALQMVLDHNVAGGFDVSSFSLVQHQTLLIDTLAQQILEEYLPEDIQSALSCELGFETPKQPVVVDNPTDQFDLIKQDLELITNDLSLSETTRKILSQARIGQGSFRTGCLKLYPTCPVTGISFQPLLRASHIKPWADCRTAQERLDPHNGIMLAAHIDTLFDSGWITFANKGDVLISNHLDFETCDKLNLPQKIIELPQLSFDYLSWHREFVFKG